MAAARIATGRSWWRLANVGPGARFTDPTVESVDFPTLALDEARWDADREELLIGPVPVNDSVVGRPRSFRVMHLDDPGTWTVTDLATGEPATTSAVERGVEIRTAVGRHRFRINR